MVAGPRVFIDNRNVRDLMEIVFVPILKDSNGTQSGHPNLWIGIRHLWEVPYLVFFLRVRCLKASLCLKALWMRIDDDVASSKTTIPKQELKISPGQILEHAD